MIVGGAEGMVTVVDAPRGTRRADALHESQRPSWTVAPRTCSLSRLPCRRRNSATPPDAPSPPPQRPALGCRGGGERGGLRQAATITPGGCVTVAVADGRYPDSGSSGSRRSIGPVRTLSRPVNSRTRPGGDHCLAWAAGCRYRTELACGTGRIVRTAGYPPGRGSGRAQLLRLHQPVRTGRGTSAIPSGTVGLVPARPVPLGLWRGLLLVFGRWRLRCERSIRHQAVQRD